MGNRLRYLDGHRGIAILIVFFFHAFARWTNVVPYGDRYKTPFETGWVGVELFFLISGFVILMTLEKCRDLKVFIFRRWVRLFPAMLFCSAVIFVSASLFPERPLGQPSLISLLPGLLFVEPSWLKHLLGQPIDSLEGAYWSLYVEFKFYVLGGIIYFCFGRLTLVLTLAVLSALTFCCKWLSYEHPMPILILVSKLQGSLSLQFFGWFAAGAAAYVYTQTRDARWFVSAAALALLSSLFVKVSDLVDFWDWESISAAVVVSTLFLASIVCPWLQKVLETRFFQFFGFISYPLYLLHENLTVATVVKLGHLPLTMPMYFFPFVPLAGLCLLAYACAKYIEPWLKNMLTRKFFQKWIEGPAS